MHNIYEYFNIYMHRYTLAIIYIELFTHFSSESTKLSGELLNLNLLLQCELVLLVAAVVWPKEPAY